MTEAPDVVYIGPAMDVDGNPTWGCDWVQIGDWDTSIDGLTFSEYGKRFVDADLHAELMRAADEVAEAAEESVLVSVQSALTAYQQAKEKLG